MKRLFIGAVVILIFLTTVSVASAYVAASANFQLEKDSINFGGTESFTSTNYANQGTLGEFISGLANGASFDVGSGYRYMNLDVVPILGCIDATADNFNSLATQNDGSCTYTTGGTGTVLSTSTVATTTPPVTIAPTRFIEEPERLPAGVTEAPNIQVITQPSPLWNFIFLQPQEPSKTFDQQMRVSVVGNKNLTIVLDAKLAPASLKTIFVTLTDPLNPKKTFSFLMHRNVAGTAYEATIGPLIRSGVYPIDIYIINYDNQATARISGRLIVRRSISFIEQVLPVAVTAGLLVGLWSTLYDFLIALYRLIASWFGRKKNENPWGTVYDSVTKQPLDPVYLSVMQNGVEVTTAITDIDGRFSFFLPAGVYTIKADKTHYRFPSERLAGKTADELYNHLYFGEPLTMTGEAITAINIPMDPIDFDWNEFAKTKTNFFRFYNWRQLWLRRLYKFIFGSGFVLSIYSLFLSLIWWNIAIVTLYVALLALNLIGPKARKPLQVLKASAQEPLSFAIIRVFLPDLNQQIKYVVADKFGRFHLLVRPGVYYYTVEEKQMDGSYHQVFKSAPINLPNGVLTSDILVK